MMMPGLVNFFPRGTKLGAKDDDQCTKMKSGWGRNEREVAKHHK